MMKVILGQLREYKWFYTLNWLSYKEWVSRRSDC